MKRVLITGANSYIGTSFEKYLKQYYCSYLDVDTIDMLDGKWREADFSKYDIVFHVAGIAHSDIGDVSSEEIERYYNVNTKLAIETAEKSKNQGVKLFVFMSSAIIYGDSAPYGSKKIISRETEPKPSNFYGDSKLQADIGIRALGSDSFKVAVLRPPMIYGYKSKGNYPRLSNLAKRVPLFPNVKNERSVLYIENLCEFLCQIMINNKNGIFWPQNSEYVSTSDIVKNVAEVCGKKVTITKALNWLVTIASHIPGKLSRSINKAFGNMCYDKDISKYDFEYQKIDFKTSIQRTEGQAIDE